MKSKKHERMRALKDAYFEAKRLGLIYFKAVKKEDKEK